MSGNIDAREEDGGKLYPIAQMKTKTGLPDLVRGGEEDYQWF